MAPTRAVRIGQVTLVVVAALVAYLGLWPVPIAPVAWTAPRPPARTGPYAPNQRLRGVTWLGRGVALGPEATALDAAGRVYTGTRDGRILRLDPPGTSFVEVARTGGRPLGLAVAGDGTLYVADAQKGLLALRPDGRLETLARSHEGVPFGFTDDLDVGPDGTVYFSDASSKFGAGQFREDLLEHGGHGRLFAWHPATRRTELLLAGLQFANGVAVAGDGSYLLVNETGAYRIQRVWLQGPRRGQAEPFIENLPGFPDNVTWSATRRAFWVALPTPRIAALDRLAGHPALRKVVYRLPGWMQPQMRRHAWILAIDEQGRVVESLEDTSPQAYAPITSVRERAGTLWLGSLNREALGQIAAP